MVMRMEAGASSSLRFIVDIFLELRLLRLVMGRMRLI